MLGVSAYYRLCMEGEEARRGCGRDVLYMPRGVLVVEERRGGSSGGGGGEGRGGEERGGGGGSEERSM